MKTPDLKAPSFLRHQTLSCRTHNRVFELSLIYLWLATCLLFQCNFKTFICFGVGLFKTVQQRGGNTSLGLN